MTQDHAARMLARLQALNWHDEDAFEYRKSRTMLMREYLRRAAWWAQELHATDEWPFFDIAAHIAPSVHISPCHIEELEDLEVGKLGLGPVATSVYAAVRWATMLDTPGVDLPALDDPFEPLVMTYERGGGFYTKNGFIELNLAAVPIRSWRDHLSSDRIIPLDPAVLDSFDEAERRNVMTYRSRSSPSR
jgi:hypothetical protein